MDLCPRCKLAYGPTGCSAAPEIEALPYRDRSDADWFALISCRDRAIQAVLDEMKRRNRWLAQAIQFEVGPGIVVEGYIGGEHWRVLRDVYRSRLHPNGTWVVPPEDPEDEVGWGSWHDAFFPTKEAALEAWERLPK